MTPSQIIEDTVARAIHKADRTHGNEPYGPSKGQYREMAAAAIAAYKDTQGESK